MLNPKVQAAVDELATIVGPEKAAAISDLIASLWDRGFSDGLDAAIELYRGTGILLTVLRDKHR